MDGERGDHIIIAPAYTITDAELDELIGRIVRLVKDFFGHQLSNGQQEQRLNLD